MFENCNNTLKKGSLGLSRAIYEYQKLGYTVLLPLIDAQDYDLVIEKDNKFLMIQCKSTSQLSRSNTFVVKLQKIKTNTKKTIIADKGIYDILFVLTSDGECYSIPYEVLPRTCLELCEKYQKYKII